MKRKGQQHRMDIQIGFQSSPCELFLQVLHELVALREVPDLGLNEGMEMAEVCSLGWAEAFEQQFRDLSLSIEVTLSHAQVLFRLKRLTQHLGGVRAKKSSSSRRGIQTGGKKPFLANGTVSTYLVEECNRIYSILLCYVIVSIFKRQQKIFDWVHEVGEARDWQMLDIDFIDLLFSTYTRRANHWAGFSHTRLACIEIESLWFEDSLLFGYRLHLAVEKPTKSELRQAVLVTLCHQLISISSLS